MKIIKRNGLEQDYQIEKIKRVIMLANEQSPGFDRITSDNIDRIVKEIDSQIKQFNTIAVETIQDKVEEALVRHNYFTIAKNFILFRNEKLNKKKFTPVEEKILNITDCKAEDVSGDNANKNPIVLPTQRDYISGEVCKSIAKKILPKEIVENHNKGAIHWHDMDYSPVQHFTNCGLVNLKGMFENGFLLNSTWIEPPKSFRTACNLASQIALHVSSQQYGGQTMSWAHLAKFVQVSRSKIASKFREYLIFLGLQDICNTEKFTELVEKELLQEIKDGVQTFQFQLITLQGTNGQSPFISMSMDFNDCDCEQTEKDLAIVLKEVLKQRKEGVLNEKKQHRPVLFPKLLLVTDEGFTANENDKYWDIVKDSAECIVESMQPDIISAKKSRELKDGQVIKCMGAAAENELVTIKYGNGNILENTPIGYVIGLINGLYNKKEQPISYVDDSYTTYYTDVSDLDIQIKSNNKWVKVLKTYINYEDCPLKLYEITFNDKQLYITEDHPLKTNRGRILARDLQIGDKVFNSVTNEPYDITSIVITDKHVKTYDFETENDMFDLSGIVSHNCRSFLQPYYKRTELTDFNMPCRLDSTKEWVTLKDIKQTDRFNNGYKVIEIQNDKVIVDEPITWGRFNQGVVTLNIPYVALESRRSNEEFFTTLDKYLEICRKALIIRHQSVEKIKPKFAPMLWMWGAYLNLGPEDSLKDYLTNENNGYTSISLGYVGLYETVRVLTGESNTSEKGEKLAYEILTHINERLAEWKKEDNLPYSIYATPEETTTAKFAEALKREFGKIDYVTDHNYVTNSYHVNPAEEIDAFSKLKFESKFLDKTTGGAVSYIEVSPSIKKNKEAIISLIKYMNNTILYSEINTKLDFCYVCNSNEELCLIQNDHNKYIFKCKICGNTDQTKMSGIRRLCGYIGEVVHGISSSSPASNQGRLDDIHARRVHL